MKIIIKTLQGKQLPLEVEETDTVGQVKLKIQAEHQMQADLMKLIAYGKVMEEDNKTLKDYSIKEGDFIVVMISKAKPAPKGKPEDTKMEEAPRAQPAQNQPSQAQAQSQPAAQQQQQPQPAQQPVPGSGAGASGPALTPELEVAVNELIMISGKPRDQCILALRAAYGNPDRAFEFLLSGVNLNALSAQIGAGGQPGAEGGQPGGEDFGDDYGDEEGSADVGGNPFAFLQQNPNFAMIRQRILQDPSFYQQFMQQLSQTQPQIYNLIQQNPGAFMNLILGGDAALGGLPGAGAGAGAGLPGAGGHSHGAGAPGQIRVTQEEMEAINRLVSLGFSKHRAAEAYFACDKNEEMAANYLFETGIEDEEAALQESIAASSQSQQQPAQQQQPGQQQPGSGQQQPPSDNNDKKNDDDDSSLM